MGRHRVTAATDETEQRPVAEALAALTEAGRVPADHHTPRRERDPFVKDRRLR